MPSKILIVDDDASLCRMMKQVLEEEKNVAVEICTDLRAAWGKMRKSCPQLIFLDIRMPGGNGLQFLKRVRKLYPEVPVLMLTGYADLKSAQAALELGATEYLTKPLDIKVLKKVVKNSALEPA